MLVLDILGFIFWFLKLIGFKIKIGYRLVQYKTYNKVVEQFQARVFTNTWKLEFV